MGLDAIGTQIVTILSAVSGVENVHDFERWAKDWTQLLAQYKTSTGKLKGWQVFGYLAGQRRMTVGEIERAYIYTLRTIYAINDEDESDKTFRLLLESVSDAFLPEHPANGDGVWNLNGTCETIEPDWGPMAGEVGLSWAEPSPRLFGSVLCHYAQGKLCAITRITG